VYLTVPDERTDYGEDRFISVRFLDGRMILKILVSVRRKFESDESFVILLAGS